MCTRIHALRCQKLKVFEKLGHFFFKGILFRIRQMVELIVIRQIDFDLILGNLGREVHIILTPPPLSL
jgi:hypothetical protein